MKKPGYPNIIIGGTGFEFPVYKWDGAKYIFMKKIKDGAIKPAEGLDISEFSKSYTSAM